MAKEMISFAKAKLAATTRLPLRTERQIAKRLEQWQLTSAEAFIQGAEEAQREFIRRINLLRPYPPSNACEKGMHEWCMNRDTDETHCTCKCHKRNKADLPVMTGADVARIFAPLPAEEAALMREYGVDDSCDGEIKP